MVLGLAVGQVPRKGNKNKNSDWAWQLGHGYKSVVFSESYMEGGGWWLVTCMCCYNDYLCCYSQVSGSKGVGMKGRHKEEGGLAS